MLSFIAFSNRSIQEKYNPLEEDLKILDPELLEVVIHPMDQEKLMPLLEIVYSMR